MRGSIRGALCAAAVDGEEPGGERLAADQRPEPGANSSAGAKECASSVAATSPNLARRPKGPLRFPRRLISWGAPR
jgi:hypothetical protein